MKPLREFDAVRVLGFGPERYLDIPDLRAPRIGDVGVILEIRENRTFGTLYVAEMVAPNGSNVWLAEFLEEELEWISSAGDGTAR